MRNQLLTSAALLTISAGSAFAAPPAFTWTGCYVGLHAGADWGQSTWSNYGSATMDTNGAIGGAQAGCNYQVQSFVLGVEGEIWGSGLTGSTNFSDGEGTETLKTTSNFAGDLAARFGYAIDRALIFGKVGVASADYRYTDVYTDTEGVTIFDAQGHATHTGLLLGLGLEYAIDAHWSFKGEYDYINYASKNVSFYEGGLFGSAAIHNTENIVKVGANYRF
jgi:outer membrane immunogenic protein